MATNVRVFTTLLVFLVSLTPLAAQTEDASQLPLQKGHTLGVHEIKWSPNDRLLLTYSGADGLLNIWAMPQAKLIASITDSSVKPKGTDKRAFRALGWSNDSRLIATGSESGIVHVWEAETGKLVWSARVATEYVTGVGFSRDSKYLATIASPEEKLQKNVALLDATTGQIVKQFDAGQARFLTYAHDAKLVFNDDNKELVVGDKGATVSRWDIATGSRLSERKLSLCANRRRPNSFVYSDDVTLLVARCGLQTETIDTTSGEVIRTHTTTSDFSNAVAISRDKQFMVLGDVGVTKLFDLQQGVEVILNDNTPINCGCDFNKDNSLVAISDYIYGNSVKIVELKSKKIISRIEAHPDQIRALTFSPDGKLLASGSDDRIVRVWDAETGALLRSLAGHTERVKIVAFTPDGTLLVSASDDQTLKVWDTNSWQLLRSVPVNADGVDGLSSIAFSPDSKQMVSTLRTTVGLWDVSTWREIKSFATDDDLANAHSAQFDARGQLIIASYEDGAIRVWDPKSQTRRSQIVRVIKTSKRNESFAVSPAARVLIANDGETAPKLWNWSTGRSLRALGDDASYVHEVAFSPDGRAVATSDIGGDVLLWNAATGKLLRKFDVGYSSDDALAFSPDGRRLATGGKNQNIVMLDAKTGARLWHILPIDEIHRPTPTEVAERESAILAAAAREKLIARVTAELSNKVSISFSHFGEPTNPAETRMAETGLPNKSLVRQNAANATGIWLRLHNHSRLPISLSTESVYLQSQQKCGYQTSRKFVDGLCEGAEIGIRFAVLDSKGRSVRYGFDFGGLSILPPNTTVLFSLPRELLRGRSIVVSYTFLNEDEKGKLEDYGKSLELKFSEANLRKK